MVSVLITRPQAASERMAQALRHEGYNCVIEPLLTIIPIAAPKPDSIPQAIMITSANAVDALEAEAANLDDLIKLPCFCVGPRTAERAQAFGFKKTFYSNSDGAELATLITGNLKDKKLPVLHIAGHDIDSKAHDALMQNDFNVITWAIYRSKPVQQLSPELLNKFQKQQLDAAVFFSPRTAETMKTLLRQHGIEACCQSLIAIGLSEAVTEALRPLPWRKSLAAPDPTQDAVIKCLKDSLPAR
jgi:uroporphyrinogen-III synthase